jgi:hypothetical protein
MESSGSGMEKNLDPPIRDPWTNIRDQHPKPATLMETLPFSPTFIVHVHQNFLTHRTSFFILLGNAEGSDLPTHENPVQLGL